MGSVASGTDRLFLKHLIIRHLASISSFYTDTRHQEKEGQRRSGADTRQLKQAGRILAGLDQNELARLGKVHPSTIIRLEGFDGWIPSFGN